jgi:hypothetical protein
VSLRACKVCVLRRAVHSWSPGAKPSAEKHWRPLPRTGGRTGCFPRADALGYFLSSAEADSARRCECTRHYGARCDLSSVHRTDSLKDDSKRELRAGWGAQSVGTWVRKSATRSVSRRDTSQQIGVWHGGTRAHRDGGHGTGVMKAKIAVVSRTDGINASYHDSGNCVGWSTVESAFSFRIKTAYQCHLGGCRTKRLGIHERSLGRSISACMRMTKGKHPL